MTSTSKITTDTLGPMKSPSHPGEVIWFAILEPLGLSITRASEMLGVRRATMSDIVNGKSALTAEMALRLQKAFGVDPDMMLRLQVQYDLAQVRKRAKKIKVKRYQHRAA